MNNESLNNVLKELIKLGSKDAYAVIAQYEELNSKFGALDVFRAAIDAYPSIDEKDMTTIKRIFIQDDPADALPEEKETEFVYGSVKNFSFTVAEWVLSNGVSENVDVINFGKDVAAAYRGIYDENPNQEVRSVNGLDIKINIYEASDVPMIKKIAHKYMPEWWRNDSLPKKPSL